MKFRLIALFLLLTVPFAHADRDNVRFGYLLEGMTKLDSRDIQLGYAYMANRFAKRYDINVEVIYDISSDKAVERFLNDDIEYLGMQAHAIIPYWDRLEPHMGMVMVSSGDNETLQRYVLLTNIPDAHGLGDLRKKRLVIQEHEINAEIYADWLSLSTYKTRSVNYFSLLSTPSQSRAILMLYFGQADAAIVPLRAWETAKALNPKITEKVSPMIISAPMFPYGVEIYRKNLSLRLQELALRSNKDIETTEEGHQLLRIIKVKSRVQVTPEKLKTLLKIYFDYDTLIKQYRKDVQ